MTSNLLAYVLDRLTHSRGQWARIAQATGVPYHTITKIAQRKISDPRLSKIERLANYFRAQHPELHTERTGDRPKAETAQADGLPKCPPVPNPEPAPEAST